MNEDLEKMLFDLIPAHVKEAAASFNLHKLAPAIYGTEDVTLEKVAEHLCQRITERQERWKAIGDGLLALDHLRR